MLECIIREGRGFGERSVGFRDKVCCGVLLIQNCHFYRRLENMADCLCPSLDSEDAVGQEMTDKANMRDSTFTTVPKRSTRIATTEHDSRQTTIK
jgi:hypothetical protein